MSQAFTWLLTHLPASGPTCAGCHRVPVDRRGQACSPVCWGARH